MTSQAGTPVLIRTAFDEWRYAVAVSGIEPTHRDGRKIHNFPVIWVQMPHLADPLPWPAGDVREQPAS
jgi:hypothetical protein